MLLQHTYLTPDFLSLLPRTLRASSGVTWIDSDLWILVHNDRDTV